MPPTLRCLVLDSTQVSGHEFTHAAKPLKKSKALLPQALAPSSLRPQAETLSAVEGAAQRQNRSSSAARELRFRPASRKPWACFAEPQKHLKR
jgi:hypothetical protein